MIKHFLTFLVLALPASALAAPVVFADRTYRYTTSTFTSVTFDGVGQINPVDDVTGQSLWFDLLLYGAEFKESVANGVYHLSTRTATGFNDFEIVGPDGVVWTDIDLTLTFFNQFIVAWFGEVRDGSSGDGFAWIESGGEDIFRPYFDTTNRTTFPGFWSFPIVQQYCGSPSGLDAEPCNGPTPPSEVPLQGGLAFLGAGLLALLGLRRKSTG